MKKSIRRLATVLVMSITMSTMPQCIPGNVGVIKIEASTKKSSTVKYTIKNGVVTIKGKGKMPKSMTFTDNKKINKVVIKNGITSIPDSAFRNCTKLKEVKIASSVEEIGIMAFYNTGIKKITIPKNVSKIGNRALGKCKKLEYIKMPGNAVVDGSEEGPDILNAEAKIGTIEFSTDLKLETISYLYANNFKVYSGDKLYKDIDGVVYTKDGKEIVRVPSGRKKLKVADECEVFCTNAVFYSVWEYGEPKGFCTRLEEVTLPKSVKRIEYNKHFAINSGAPYDVDIEDWVIENDKIVGLDNLVYGICKGYWNDLDLMEEYLKFPSLITVDEDMITSNGTLLYYRGKNQDVVIPNGITRIGRDAFYDYPHRTMKSLVLPEGLEEIGMDNFASQLIKSVRIPSTVNNIDSSAFAYCSLLSDVELNDGLTNISSRVFEGCNNLEKIELPDSITTIGESAFRESGLREIVLPKNLVSIGECAFYKCNLENIVIPNTVNTIGGYAFGETNMKEVYIPDSVVELGDGLFYDSRIENVRLPKKMTEIKSSMFMYSELKNITIPSKVKKIKKDAFFGTNITEVTIPKSVKKIEKEAFAQCCNLKSVNIKNSKTDINKQAFNGSEKVVIKGKLKASKCVVSINLVDTEYNKKSNTYKFNWNKVASADEYQVMLAGNRKFTKNKTVKNIKKNKFTKKVKSGELTYIRVRSCNKVKGKKVYGKWSEIIRMW